jgi:hypothetical protein
MKDSFSRPIAETRFFTIRTSPTDETGPATNELDVFRGVRQTFTWTKRSNLLLGQLVWPGNLQHLLV